MNMHKNMNNQEVVTLLRSIAASYEIRGENTFRIRAYDTAADSVEHSAREVKDLWEEGKLDQLPGIGANMTSHFQELFTKGKVGHFQRVLKDFPEAMFTLMQVPGIGPKTAYKLSKSLGIRKAKGSVARLQKAAELGKIREIEGFGKESELAILKGIDEYSRRENRMLLPAATKLAEELLSYMQKEKAVLRVDPLGSLRRRMSTVGDIDLAAATKDPARVIEHFKSYPHARQILVAGENTARFILRSGRQVDIKTQTPERYGSLLQHFTGSKSHNIRLREIALEKHLSLSEHGIKSGGKIRRYPTEKGLYRALGMEWITPELREDTGEIETAAKKKLPKLVEASEIRGDLHLHTDYDWQSSHDEGVNSMREMVEKAIDLGYEYVGIGDHNPSTSAYSSAQTIAQVKKRTRLLSQVKNLYEKAKKQHSIKILNSLEVDILANGKLALENEAMNMLDYAVVSIHSSMRMSKERMTDRIIKGLSHPKAKILGHPTGRLLNKREGYEADWGKIFAFAKKHRKLIEINAWPTRLDLPDTLVRDAVSTGVQLVINTDAHATEHMSLMRYGTDVARRGWASAGHIANTFPLEKLEKVLLNGKAERG